VNIRSVLVVALTIPATSWADWRVVERIDAMTDEVRKSAIVDNDHGHSFSVYRLSAGGPVWGNFSLSERKFDQVDWEKPPMYRVDRHEPVNLKRMKDMHEMGLGIQAYEWEPKWVNFLIWHGKEEEGIAENLVELMEGEKVVFRYYLSTGGYKDTAFPLSGAAAAISTAVGIDAEIDHSAQRKAEEFKDAYTAESKKCQRDLSTFKRCLERMEVCRKQSEYDVDRFQNCMR